jgi:site-specific recombinase XerD
MVSLKVRHLHQVHGRWYWIPSKSAHALGFRSSPLGTDLHEARSKAERLNAQLDAERKRMTAPEKVEQGTVKDLIARYRKSTYYTKLAIETRKGYADRLARIEAKAGSLKVKGIQRTDMVQTYEKLKVKYSPAMAASIMRVWRLLMSYAYNIGWIEHNPALKIRVESQPSRAVVWTPEQVAALIAAAEAAGRPSVALAAKLAHDSGQRPTDVLRLSWSQWEGSGFWVTQSKTGQKVFAPVSPQLAAELNTMTKEGIYLVLSEATKRPYKRHHFAHEFARIRASSGLPSTLQFRDLRRTAATEMGNSGATDDEIRAVTGHRTRGTVAVYVRPDRTMSEAGQGKRFGDKSLKSGDGEV